MAPRTDEWRTHYENGRRALDGVSFTFEAFLAYVDGLGLEPQPEGLQAADLYLAGACLAGDQRAIAIFDRDLVGPARGAIMRVDASPDFVAEALQELRQRLLVGPPPRLASFLGRGPLAVWVRVAASRVALDLARAAAPERAADAEVIETLAASTADPGVRLLRETYGDAFQSALRETVTSLGARERNLLRFHVLDGLSIDEIAAPYGVHRATAARWLNAVHESIFKGVCDRLRAHNPRLDTAELESLVRAVRSDLHISLWRLLASVSGAAASPVRPAG
jgi:RNA polymerase sigma-70 factor (ECF subfamily)